VSSLGSFITVMRVMLFVVIVWESFVAQRSLVSINFNSVSLETVGSYFPHSFHSNEEFVAIYSPSLISVHSSSN